MNAPVIICLVLCIGFGVYAAWSRNLDLSEYHIAHGPDSGCPDCEDK